MVDIADRVILVQAIRSSGALSTARLALSNKPLYRVHWPSAPTPANLKKAIPINATEIKHQRYSNTLKISICKPPILLHKLLASKAMTAKENAVNVGKWLSNGELKPISLGVYHWAQ